MCSNTIKRMGMYGIVNYVNTCTTILYASHMTRIYCCVGVLFIYCYMLKVFLIDTQQTHPTIHDSTDVKGSKHNRSSFIRKCVTKAFVLRLRYYVYLCLTARRVSHNKLLFGPRVLQEECEEDPVTFGFLWRRISYSSLDNA